MSSLGTASRPRRMDDERRTVPFLGRYMADAYGARDDGSAPGDRFFGPIERTIYRICGIDSKREQRWNVYATSLLAFSLVSVLLLYSIFRLQGVLPFNPTDRLGVSPRARSTRRSASSPTRPRGG